MPVLVINTVGHSVAFRHSGGQFIIPYDGRQYTLPDDFPVDQLRGVARWKVIGAPIIQEPISDVSKQEESNNVIHIDISDLKSDTIEEKVESEVVEKINITEEPKDKIVDEPKKKTRGKPAKRRVSSNDSKNKQ